MFKKMTFSVIGVLLGLSVNIANASDTLRIGIEGAYPPFSEKTSDGKLIGFDVDIASALCKEMKRSCVMVEQGWDGMIPGLLARKFDAIIASLTITKERQKKIDFSKKYYATPGKFVARKDEFSNDKPSTLAGKVIGVQSSTPHADFLKFTYPNSTIREYGSQEEVYLDLTAGRLDAILADSIALSKGFLHTDSGKGFSFFGENHEERDFFGEGLGIGVRKGDVLKDEFTKAIEKIRENGVYKKINDKYFDFDVYGE